MKLVRKTRSRVWQILTLTVMCLSLSIHPSALQAKQKNVGVQLYSVMSDVQKDPVRSIERLAAMGYKNVELVQWGGDPKVFGMEPKEFKAACKRNGIRIVSTHSSLQEDPEKEEEVMDHWRKLFEVQKSCGGKYFVIPSYHVDYTVEEVQRMCDYFNRVGRLAKKYGLTLGYHNHDGEFKNIKGTSLTMWEYLVEHTDPRYVCFELDVYWCTRGGKDPLAYLQKYPDRIQILHVKDEFVIGKSGKIDFEKIFTQFHQNGWKNYFVEIETPGFLRERKLTEDQILQEKWKALAESITYLKNAPFVK